MQNALVLKSSRPRSEVVAQRDTSWRCFKRQRSIDCLASTREKNTGPRMPPRSRRPRRRRQISSLIAWRSDAREKFKVKDATWLTTHETPTEGGLSHCLHGGARARDEFEVKETRSVPPPAAALRAVLEFEFLSRKIAAKPSMRTWRCDQRVPHTLLYRRAHVFNVVATCPP